MEIYNFLCYELIFKEFKEFPKTPSLLYNHSILLLSIFKFNKKINPLHNTANSFDPLPNCFHCPISRLHYNVLFLLTVQGIDLLKLLNGLLKKDKSYD